MSASKKTIFHGVFAPDHGWLTEQERAFRRECCLNGSWQFQPIPVPTDYVRNQGEPPTLPLPQETAWSDTPIRIPSPWNGNIWGNGRVDRSREEMRYRPDSLYYPSYPAEWDHAEMGWLRRSFTVPDDWAGMRVLLHFEAVMGHADIYVNGEQVGEHFDGYLPFDCDVTDVLREGENELLVGVRHLRLYNHQSAIYKNMRTPYAHGSNTQDLAGIWQDVYLLAVPPVSIEDVYVKPLLDSDTLELDVTIRNDTDQPQTVQLVGEVCPWIDCSTDVVPASRSGKPAMTLTARTLLLSPHSTATVTCADVVGGRLACWSPETPHLYTAELALTAPGIADRKSTRFGWRQYRLRGQKLYLNGVELHLVGDICHPFGPFMFSRRFIRSWYGLIKSVGGNAVRLHAQIHPRVFLDVADEMGIAVLDETAIFGSCLTLNFEDDVAWERYAAHYDGLILRDRNRPSVFGWSFGNELFAIFLYDEVAKRDEAAAYAKLFELGNRTRRLDVTREFVTCDGDEDLRGTLPVWSKHYGHGICDLPADVTKPMVVGENGGTYYARPEQLAIFNGERAFASYVGRNQALGIDLYNQLRHFDNRLIYFSPSELMWFGLEHLPYGYDDFSRLPTFEDGVFFPDFEEGRPGMYIERIPPYVGTLNPGFDPALPEYRPLGMAEAMRDALRYDPALDGKWRVELPVLPEPPVWTRRLSLRFIGSPDSAAYRALGMAGARFSLDGELAIIDAGSCGESAGETLTAVTAAGGVVLVLIPDAAAAARANRWLPCPVELTDRQATMLVRGEADPWVDSLGLEALYFAESRVQKAIMEHGIAGELSARGRVLLEAANVDWSLFNNVPENAKCGGVVLYEHLEKQPGAALVSLPVGSGTVAVTTVRMEPDSPEHLAFYHRLLENMGAALEPVREIADDGPDFHDLLLNGPVSN